MEGTRSAQGKRGKARRQPLIEINCDVVYPCVAVPHNSGMGAAQHFGVRQSAGEVLSRTMLPRCSHLACARLSSL